MYETPIHLWPYAAYTFSTLTMSVGFGLGPILAAMISVAPYFAASSTCNPKLPADLRPPLARITFTFVPGVMEPGLHRIGIFSLVRRLAQEQNMESCDLSSPAVAVATTVGLESAHSPPTHPLAVLLVKVDSPSIDMVLLSPHTEIAPARIGQNGCRIVQDATLMFAIWWKPPPQSREISGAKTSWAK